jgi:protein CpxP
MKKILTLAVLFTGLSVTSFAQEKSDNKRSDRKEGKSPRKEYTVKSPEDIAKIRTERLDKELKFTDKQRQEVYTYNLDQAKKLRQRSETRKKERVALQNEMKADRDRFKNLLTEDQQKIMKERIAKRDGNRIHKRGQHFKGRKDGDRPMRKKIEKSIDATEEGSNS